MTEIPNAKGYEWEKIDYFDLVWESGIGQKGNYTEQKHAHLSEVDIGSGLLIGQILKVD